MIGFRDSLLLARTKLRAKKVLLIVTIIIASLLFGVIIMSTLVATGASKSARSYLESALGGKYLVSVNPVIPTDVMGFSSVFDAPSDELKAHLLELEKQYIAEQEALAKEYGVEFDSDAIEPIIQPSPFDLKDEFGNVVETLNRNSPVHQRYVQELQDEWLKTTKSTIPELKKRANTFGATEYYQNQHATTSYMNTTYLGSGEAKEDLMKVVQPQPPGGNPTEIAVQNSYYTLIDQALIERYMLPENELRAAGTMAIPVVIAKDEATKMFGEQLGLAEEPSDAKGKIAWVKTLQEKMNGLTYKACYRSSGEISLIQQVMRNNQTIKPEVSIEPPVTYQLSEEACMPVRTTKDDRTSSEKQAAANREAYQKAAGTYQPRDTQLLTFQVVGIMPTDSMNYTNDFTNVSEVMNGILGAQYYGGAFIPRQLYERLPAQHQHADALFNTNSEYFIQEKKLIEAGVEPAIVSFTSAEAAKRFIDSETCFSLDSNCEKLWTSQLYGPNYLVIDDINKKVIDIARLALPIALGIAIVITSFTMTRVIIDSRRETAIFRAIGAKRIDIMRIYLTYSVLVALLVAGFAFVLGIAGAVGVELFYGPEVTSYAKVAYGVFDGLGSFSLIGFDVRLLGAIGVAIVAVGLAAVLPPLLLNVGRSPLRNMSDN